MPRRATGGPTCASSATWSRTSPDRCDAVVFLQTIEHIEDVTALLAAIGAAAPLAFISTPNRLTLAPEGAEKSDNPWHLREYTIEEYRELLEPAFAEVEVRGLFHAGKLAVHERAIGLGWDRVHRLLRLTKPFYDRFTPAISASDFSLTRVRGGSRAGRSTSWPSAGMTRPDGVRTGASGGGGSDGVGDIAIVLHSHMPYVEGFGTYPFGEEWLFDAVVRSHLPVLAAARDLTMTVTPVLADQLEDPGAGERLLEFVREYRIGSAELDAARRRAGARAGLRGGGRPLPRRADALERARRRRPRRLRGARGLGPDRAASPRPRPTPSSRCSPPVRPRCCRSSRAALPPAPLRPPAGHLAARMRLRARPRAPARRARDRVLLHRSVALTSPPRRRCARSRTAGPTAFPIDWEAIQWLWSLERLSLRPPLRRLPPQVAARLPALVDRRRRLRPGRRRRARARAGAEFAAASRPGSRGYRDRARAAAGLLVVRDRHRAARPLVVGGADLARARSWRAARARASARSR